MAWRYANAGPIQEVSRPRCRDCGLPVYVTESYLRLANGDYLCETDAANVAPTLRNNGSIARMMVTNGAPNKRDSKGVLKRAFAVDANKRAKDSSKGWKKSR